MRNLRTEEEIVANWKGSHEKPVVSICCITYNHGSYIEDALEGFLIQETDFPFEILIHDDASTDRTAEIVREYEAKYPKLIKPIYQSENQYSKLPVISPRFLFPIAKGEYIAMCEGDDYWTDVNKLQIQITAMKGQPEIGISFHPAYLLKDEKISGIMARRHNKDKIYTASEMILGGGGFCPTPSLIIKREKIINLPEWFYKEAPVGDYFFQIFSSLNDGALYIDKVMSVYRFLSTSSVTLKSQQDVDLSIDECKAMISCLMKFDLRLNKNFHKEFSKAISLSILSVLRTIEHPIHRKKIFYSENKKNILLKHKLLWIFIFKYKYIQQLIRKVKSII
jgi:glycosyltransferase involved in cell wall biosynthesis